MEKIREFIKDEDGLETVEYAIILGLIVGGVIVLVATLGTWVQAQFQSVVTETGAGS